MLVSFGMHIISNYDFIWLWYGLFICAARGTCFNLFTLLSSAARRRNPPLGKTSRHLCLLLLCAYNHHFSIKQVVLMKYLMLDQILPWVSDCPTDRPALCIYIPFKLSNGVGMLFIAFYLEMILIMYVWIRFWILAFCCMVVLKGAVSIICFGTIYNAIEYFWSP